MQLQKKKKVDESEKYQSLPSLSGSSHIPHLLQFIILTLGLYTYEALSLQNRNALIIIPRGTQKTKQTLLKKE